jgi:hypothetical protein
MKPNWPQIISAINRVCYFRTLKTALLHVLSITDDSVLHWYRLHESLTMRLWFSCSNSLYQGVLCGAVSVWSQESDIILCRGPFATEYRHNIWDYRSVIKEHSHNTRQTACYFRCTERSCVSFQCSLIYLLLCISFVSGNRLVKR